MKKLFRPLYKTPVNRYRRWKKLRHNRNILKAQAKQMMAKGESVKVVIGAGGTDFEGWIITNLPYLDALKAEDWARIFTPGSIDRILSEHVFEHLSTDQFRIFLRVVQPYLSAEGRIRISVPDGHHPDPDYIESARPGGTGPGAYDHKVFYTHTLIAEVLTEEGYAYRLLEYFDQEGEFHQTAWDAVDGFMQRSADHDPRNREKPLSYTSLILDCWPE